MTGWLFLALSYCSLFVMSLVDNSRGPLFSEILRELHLSDVAGGQFFAASSFSALMINMTMSFWYPRLGLVGAVRVFMVLLSAGAYVVSESQSFLSLGIGGTLLGVALGGLSFCNNQLVTEGAAAKIRTKAFAGLHSMYAIGSLLSPIFIAMILGPHQGWREVFRLLSILPILLLLGSLYFMKADSLKGAHKKAVRDLFTRSVKWKLAFAVSMSVVCELLVTSRVALYLTRYEGFDLTKSGLALSTFFAFMLLSRLAFTFVSFPFTARGVLLSCTMGATVVTLLGLLVHPFFLVMSGFFIGIHYPLTVSWVAEEADKIHSGTEQIVNLAMILSGVFVVGMHSFVGWLSDIWGLKQAFFIAPLASFAAFCLIFTLKMPNLRGENPRF